MKSPGIVVAVVSCAAMALAQATRPAGSGQALSPGRAPVLRRGGRRQRRLLGRHTRRHHRRRLGHERHGQHDQRRRRLQPRHLGGRGEHDPGREERRSKIGPSGRRPTSTCGRSTAPPAPPSAAPTPPWSRWSASPTKGPDALEPQPGRSGQRPRRLARPAECGDLRPAAGRAGRTAGQAGHAGRPELPGSGEVPRRHRHHAGDPEGTDPRRPAQPVRRRRNFLRSLTYATSKSDFN